MRAWRLSLLAVVWGGLACTQGSPRAKVSSADGGGGAGAAPTAGRSGPRKGGYLVVSSFEPRTVNPVIQAAFDVATPLIFEGLVGYDARGELVPVLAEKWERSPDGKV